MLLGANLAVASIFMQGCKAVKPNTPPPQPSQPSVVQPEPPPPKTALQNDIETTRYDEPKQNDVVATTKLPPPSPVAHKPVKPLPPPEPEYETYVVQKGDMLSRICQKRGIKQRDVLKLNPGLDPNRIYSGKKIKLPIAGAASVQAQEPAALGAKNDKLPPPPAEAKKQGDKKADPKPAVNASAANVKAPVTKKTAYKPYDGPTKEHVVKSGDQLGKLAHSYGISIRALKELNGLAGNELKIGQKLKVPAEKVKPQAAETNEPAPAPEKKDAKVEQNKAENKGGATPSSPAAPKDPAVAPAVVEPAPTPAPVVEPAVKDGPVPPATAAYETYTVKKGDDIVSIAINFGVSPSALMDLNDLKATDVVRPDQVLKIPAKAQ